MSAAIPIQEGDCTHCTGQWKDVPCGTANEVTITQFYGRGWMIKYQGTTTRWNTIRTFFKVGSCSETACNVINRAYNHPSYHEEHGAITFAGGILQHGYQCGLVWGAALGAGSNAYHRYGSGAKSEKVAILAARRLVEAFRDANGQENCIDLIEADWRKPPQVVKYFLKGGPVKCFGMAGRFGPVSLETLNSFYDQEPEDAPESPVSCASLMVRRLGGSELQAAMAAGLAGGIGLTGGACGALGAAIWSMTIAKSQSSEGKVDIKFKEAEDLLDSFLALTNHEFECNAITGKTFATVEEHAAFLQEGGCSSILDLLAQTDVK